MIGTVSILIVGFLGFKKYISEPKEFDAMNEMFTSQKYFGEAVRSDSDSLFKLSVVGDGKNYGSTRISENYPGTKAANLSNYQTGMSYLNMQNYAKAIELEYKCFTPVSKCCFTPELFPPFESPQV